MRNSDFTLQLRVNDRFIDEYVDIKKETYVEGRRGSKYEIVFTNHSNRRVLAIFSVDGLSTIDGKPASDKSQGYVVNAYQTISVPGWSIDNSKVAAFEFRPKGERDNQTYVEELRQEGFQVDVGNQGVIGVMVVSEKVVYRGEPWSLTPYRELTRSQGLGTVKQFYNSAGPFYQVVASMPLAATAGLNASAAMGVTRGVADPGLSSATPAPLDMAEASMGTGFGEDKTFNVSTVSFKRDTVVSILTLRYETREKLKALGLISDIKKTENQAFPGYSPNCHIPKSRRGA